MGQTAEELRQDIASTRDDLSDTLDAIGDRVSPGRVIERRKNRMTAGVRSALDRVMGSAHDAADAVRDAPSSVGSSTQGAPLVAGAIAFAAGFLAAVAFPPSEQETELTGQLVEPVKSQLSNIGHDVAEHLKEPAQEALAEVKGTAQGGVDVVKEAATQAASETKDSAQSAMQSVKDEATDR